MECSPSTSASTIRALHTSLSELAEQPTTSTSHVSPLASSPESSPSPPDSPSTDSVSSLPSVSSSFFFSSSAAASPPQQGSNPRSGSSRQSEHGLDQEHGLIIPSLTLSAALKRPTPFGQTLGDLRLLVLGAQGAGKSFLTGLLMEDNEDVVEVGTWEDSDDHAGKVLRASTDWVEVKDGLGLERFEPLRNVEIVELPGYGYDTDINELTKNLKDIIEMPFHSISEVLHPDNQPSAIVASLLSSPSSPLYTGLIFLLPSAPTLLDLSIIESLESHIPIIVLPRLSGPHRGPNTPGVEKRKFKLSSFKPTSAVALRTGLFHSPETVALLRGEAVDRFLRWREVERAVKEIKSAGKRKRDQEQETTTGRWTKAQWELEWMESHSLHVARRIREGTITQRAVERTLNHQREPNHQLLSTDYLSGHLRGHDDDSPNVYDPNEEKNEHYQGSPSSSISSDPLHLPSLFFFSLSLFVPLKSRVNQCARGLWGDWNWKLSTMQVAIVGGVGFCFGLGVGFFSR
ncbi:hypothetical protein BYT27DRAFT_7227712 [Phlegmacium glaucopus]|nr:hypothetical protein BYT27DRAFT_7227712 [Phlegmacium glaucopus]